MKGESVDIEESGQTSNIGITKLKSALMKHKDKFLRMVYRQQMKSQNGRTETE